MTRYMDTIIKTHSQWSGYRKRNAGHRMTDKRAGRVRRRERRERKAPIIHLFALLIETLIHRYERIMTKSSSTAQAHPSSG
jgi:hypothetical protein